MNTYEVLEEGAEQSSLVEDAPVLPPGEAWEFSDSHISVTAALQIGMPPFNVDSSLKSRVIVREIRNYTERETAAGTEIWGVSIRLMVAVQSAKLESKLTLPIVTAQAQLGLLEAHAHLSVRGFTDSGVFELGPGFEDLDVESYGKYTEASDKIRSYIGSHWASVAPVLLAKRLATPAGDAELEQAVISNAVVFAIYEGWSFDEFVRNHRQWSQDVVSQARETWRILDPETPTDEEPSRIAQARAHTIVDKLGG
jgi:hypothetical protein